jgi:hypothetical protein
VSGSLFACLIVFTLLALSLHPLTVRLLFNLPNQLCEFFPSKSFQTNPLDFQLSMNFIFIGRHSGGIATFSQGGFVFVINIEEASIVMSIRPEGKIVGPLFQLKSSNAVLQGENFLEISCQNHTVQINLNGETSEDLNEFKGDARFGTPDKVVIGSLKFMGCMSDIVFNNKVIESSSFLLSNVLFQKCG